MSEHLCEFRDKLCEALGRELVLKDEIERLRVALKEIAEYAPLEWHGMRARRALEEAGMQREA